MCEENESLKTQIKSAGGGNGRGGGEGGGGGGGRGGGGIENEKVLHLKAENIALHKSLQGIVYVHE